MDINLQLFTGGCISPVKLDMNSIMNKINKMIKKTKITSIVIGWNKDMHLSEIVQFMKYNGTEVYMWFPVFSELDALSDLPPLIGHNHEKIDIDFDIGNDENFKFHCPTASVDRVIEIYEKYYCNEVYDGIFLDKIRFPSFIGGLGSVLSCFCDVCATNHVLPDTEKLFTADSANPLGIVKYEDLRYGMDIDFQRLFDYKCDAIYHSLKTLCAYFRGKGMKIGFDLFAPFLAYFVGQDYHRLMGLADIVKPMFYTITNAPAGIPLEIDMYAKAFDDDPENAKKRKDYFLDRIGYGDRFIGKEISGIKRIVESQSLHTKLYAGVEFNYIEHIAPVTKGYIRDSMAKISQADGIVASWDLNTIPDSHIDCLLDII